MDKKENKNTNETKQKQQQAPGNSWVAQQVKGLRLSLLWPWLYSCGRGLIPDKEFLCKLRARPKRMAGA